MSDFSQLDDLTRDLTRHADLTVVRSVAAVRRTAQSVVARGQQGANVDTGLMRSTIAADETDGGLGFEAGPATHYAPFVHDGTSTIAPNPFMDRAMDTSIPELLDVLGLPPRDLAR